MTQPLRWGFGLSPDALPLLRRLLAAGLLDRLALPPNDDHWPSGGLPAFLAEEWPRSSTFVAVGACGAITRLIAPLLNHKSSDPAVVVLDPAGRFAVPLLGGHAAGGEALAQAIAAGKVTAAEIAGSFAGGLLGFLGSVVGGVFDAVTCVVFAFYLSADNPRLRIDQLMAYSWKILLPLVLVQVLVNGFVLVYGLPLIVLTIAGLAGIGVLVWLTERSVRTPRVAPAALAMQSEAAS